MHKNTLLYIFAACFPAKQLIHNLTSEKNKGTSRKVLNGETSGPQLGMISSEASQNLVKGCYTSY